MQSVELRLELVEASRDLIAERHDLVFQLAEIYHGRGLILDSESLPGGLELELVAPLLDGYPCGRILRGHVDDVPGRGGEGE